MQQSVQPLILADKQTDKPPVITDCFISLDVIYPAWSSLHYARLSQLDPSDRPAQELQHPAGGVWATDHARISGPRDKVSHQEGQAWPIRTDSKIIDGQTRIKVCYIIRVKH